MPRNPDACPEAVPDTVGSRRGTDDTIGIPGISAGAPGKYG